MMDPQNPLHPVDVDDYPKLFDYVLTAKGLLFSNFEKKLHSWKRNVS